VLAAAVAAVSGLAALIGMAWGFGLKCDDSCGTPPPWRDDVNAWQWNALGAIGIGGFACAAIFVLAIAAGRRVAAAVALAAWAGLAAAFLTLFRDSGLTSHAERGWLGLAGLAILGVAAIAVRPPRAEHGTAS
jgi:multidrug transporter EmrE-like cation transporter